MKTFGIFISILVGIIFIPYIIGLSIMRVCGFQAIDDVLTWGFGLFGMFLFILGMFFLIKIWECAKSITEKQK